MAQTHLYRDFIVFTAASIATTGDKATFTPAMPVNVVRWGVIATVAFTGAPVLTLDKRVTAGSDTGRVNGATASGVDTAGGSLTPGTLAAGKGAYREVNQVPGPFKLAPGEEAVFEVTTAAGAGTAFFYVEYELEGFTGDAGLTLAQGNRIANMTKKSS